MPKGMVTLEVDRCKGCGICVEACPEHILAMSTTQFNAKGHRPVEVLDMERCTGCTMCAVVCPDVVFTVYKQRRPARLSA